MVAGYSNEAELGREVEVGRKGAGCRALKLQRVEMHVFVLRARVVGSSKRDDVVEVLLWGNSVDTQSRMAMEMLTLETRLVHLGVANVNGGHLERPAGGQHNKLMGPPASKTTTESSTELDYIYPEHGDDYFDQST